MEHRHNLILKDCSQVAAGHLALLNMVINAAAKLFRSQGEGLTPVLSCVTRATNS